ncbi:MAG: hypothetical protein ACK2U2_01085 [Anaerolineae bacterium]|jgi:uncharacterized protein YjeT (DUF2065 family)
MLEVVNRLLAVALIADGSATLIFGHRLLAWQQRVAPVWYQMALDALLDWPEPALRVGGAVELILGLVWLKRLLRHDWGPAT